MKQFDIVANPFPRSHERQPFLVALQSDLITRALDTVVVAPLQPAEAGSPVDCLNPTVSVDGRALVLVTQELVAVRKNVLGRPQGSIEAERDKIIAALDLLFTGF